MSMTEKPKEQRDPKERDAKGQLVKGNTANLEHGGWFWLGHGRVPSVRGKRRIGRELSELRRRLMETVPGSDDIRKQVLIGQVISAQGFVLLIESFLRRYGIMSPADFAKGKLEVQGSLSYVISFLNVQARAIGQLGLDREQADKVLAPYEIVAEEKSDQHSPSAA